MNCNIIKEIQFISICLLSSIFVKKKNNIYVKNAKYISTNEMRYLPWSDAEI